MTTCKKFLWVILFLLSMGGCVSDSILKSESGSTVPQELLNVGRYLGVHFTNQVFANQTKCYPDPLGLSSNPKVLFRAICFYQDQKLGTAVFWARKAPFQTPTDFVKSNVEIIAKDRASLGVQDTANRSVVFLFEKNGISYHKVAIGESYKETEGTFFIHTQQADALGLMIVVTVKGFGLTEQEVMNKAEEMKAGVRLNLSRKTNSNTFSLIEKAYAGGGGGSESGGDSTGPALGSGTPGLGVTDSSGNAVGTGGGSSGGSNGGNGTGGSGVGSSVNGVCAGAHYTCSVGTSINNASGVSVWTWTCSGVSGGTDASCSENKPLPTGSLSASPTTCQIATGASTCATTLTWSTTDPQGTSGITRDGTTGTIFSGNSGSQSTNVPYDVDGSVTYRLYNNSIELGNTTVSVTCALGATKWDTVNNVCADPQVVDAVVGGEYYPPGTITLTCSGSDTYSVTLNGAPFAGPASYSAPVVIANVMQEGNYVIKCIHGSVFDQVTRFYDATPPTATVSLEASPITIAKDGKITMSWKTKYPTNACNLSAKVVCPNNACNTAQTNFQNSLNAILQTEKTDANDPATSRLITIAVKKIALGHLGTDWLALGRKTLQMTYTTDFTYECGAGSKETKRIQVTKSELQ